MNKLDLQVGVKVLLKNKENKFLFLRRSATDKNHIPGLWDIPGGRIEKGDNLLDNLKRELYEETRMTLPNEPTLIHAQDIIKPEKGIHVVRLTYITNADEQVPVLDGIEHDEYQWMTVEEINNEKNIGEILRGLIEHLKKS